MFVLAVTTAIAGIFFGGALYVNLVEHPSRIACGTPAAVRQFKEMYPRAAAMMGSLAALGCVLGLIASWQLHDAHIAVNAIILGFPVPFTLLVIAPVNRALIDPALDTSSAQATQLLARWVRLHTVRTILGGMAFGLMLFRMAIHGGAGAA